MRTAILLLLLLLPTLPAWCRQPEEVVREVFAYEQKVQDPRKTINHCSHCFTPGFLTILQRAFARVPGKDKSYVDWNIFGNSQTNTGHFEVGKSSRQGQDSIIPVRVWTGIRSQSTIRDAKARASWPLVRRVEVQLTDVGSGWQIRDMIWEGYDEKTGDQVEHIPPISVRENLVPIAQGR